MSMSYQRFALSLSWALGLGLWFPTTLLTADPQTRPAKPIETTITTLVESSAKFSGELRPITPRTEDRQCRQGIVPTESDKAEKDPGNQSLDRALA
jgi:hypothetical protein